MAERTRWEKYLDLYDEVTRDRVLRWWRERPPLTQDLMRKIPPNSKFLVAETNQIVHLVGYVEVGEGEPGFWLSLIDPVVDYEKSIASKFFVCGDCVDLFEDDQEISRVLMESLGKIVGSQDPLIN